MRKIFLPFLLTVVLLIGIFGVLQLARGQGEDGQGEFQVVNRETQGENAREILAPNLGEEPQQPSISFIDSPTIACYQPDPGQDACYLTWYYMSVDANPNYMISMTVTINTIGIVAKIGGFFQTSMYVPYNMLGNGFKVACGSPGAGGNPYLGKAYSWTINARDSSNLKSANYGTSYCPPYTP
jgi:hypothetical protein